MPFLSTLGGGSASGFNKFVSSDSGAEGQVLVYKYGKDGSAPSPTNVAWKGITTNSSDMSATFYDSLPSDVQANWKSAIFTSKNNPYRIRRFRRADNGGANGVLTNTIKSYLNNYAQWGLADNANNTMQVGAGSSQDSGRTITIEHNNNGGEAADIATIALGHHVWTNNMMWGCIDSFTNYGGIINTIWDKHSGSGNNFGDGDKLLVYLDFEDGLDPNNYTNYLTPTGPFGDAKENFSWSYDGTSGLGGNPKYVADAVSRNTSSSWQSYGFQQNGDNRYIQCDMGSGNAQNFDYTFVVGYPNGSHMGNRAHIYASNNGSNWITMAEWDYHPRGSTSSSPSWEGNLLTYSEGSITYNDCINSGWYWIPIYNNGTKYRYWRFNSWNNSSTNNHLLVYNWALLKRTADP